MEKVSCGPKNLSSYLKILVQLCECQFLCGFFANAIDVCLQKVEPLRSRNELSMSVFNEDNTGEDSESGPCCDTTWPDGNQDEVGGDQ